MASAFNNLKRPILCALASFCSLPGIALELGLDASFTSSTQVDDWGIGAHAQVIGTNGLGVDLGYSYLNSITYDALSSTLTHSLGQYEASLLWQRGDRGFRVQGLVGGIWSNSWVQSNSQDVITRFSPGYQAGVGVSVPVFTRVRAFADAGYQGWLNAEIPGHLSWRYGIRILFGGSGIQKLEQQELAEKLELEQQTQAELANPSVNIDTRVPEYIPGNLSQSLPPIVANAEICKCFPAGPYTLQLGEFGNMTSAIRALEYRGLRQFFNSRSYLLAPLPVFLAQADINGPVGVYLGELPSVEQMQFWRHELRKSGLQARFRKVIGSNGSRVANPIVAMVDAEIVPAPEYTDEEIRRMNSLPEDWQEPPVSQLETYDAALAEKEAYDANLAMQREQMNKVEASPAVLADTLQSGPVPVSDLLTVLGSDAMRQALAQSPSMNIPGRMSLIWDEGKQEAWLRFSEFRSEQHLDEWRAWLDAERLTASRTDQPFMPMGDIYVFELGHPLDTYSVEIDRTDNVQQMFQSMRSDEVLWFQAYQRINDQPVSTTLNWSMTDRRYHLIVSNITTQAEQQRIWANLTAVGLLPSLAEE